MSGERAIDYGYADTGAAHTHEYLWESVTRVLEPLPARRVFELGCGNGAFARHLKSAGFEVQGVDPSDEGIAHARSADPDLRLELGFRKP